MTRYNYPPNACVETFCQLYVSVVMEHASPASIARLRFDVNMRGEDDKTWHTDWHVACSVCDAPQSHYLWLIPMYHSGKLTLTEHLFLLQRVLMNRNYIPTYISYLNFNYIDCPPRYSEILIGIPVAGLFSEDGGMVRQFSPRSRYITQD